MVTQNCYSNAMFNRLMSKMLDSSVWLLPDQTRIVWITLLAAMDEDGFAHFSAIQNLADRARVTLDATQKAVEILSSPDLESGNPENEGRRIERVPGGFMVLNAGYYRNLMTREVMRAQTRERVARHRASKKGVTDSNAPVTKCNEPTEYASENESKSASVVPEEGSGGKPSAGSMLIFPGCLETEDFRKVWSDWITDRKNRKKPVTELAAMRQLKQLEGYGHDKAIISVNRSIANGWQGLFDPDADVGTGSGGARKRADDLHGKLGPNGEW